MEKEILDIPKDEAEADALLESISNPKEDTEKAQAESKPPEEYSFNYEGKEIKAPMDKLLKWASQGYGAPNRIGELNKQLGEWKQKESHLNELKTKYADVDNYVRQNPQWFEAVNQQYQQALAKQNQSAQMENHPLMNEFAGLRKQVDELSNYKNEIIRTQEDQKYTHDFELLQKANPKVDFVTPDENGKTLEYKVLEYAQQNGINNFKTAFRDFYHEDLLKLKELEAREKVVTDRVGKTKLGILGISPTPTKRHTESVKGKSYDDLMREAKEELGIS